MSDPKIGGGRTAQCEMIIGYLVPHRCDNPALGRCVKCGRGFCDEHVDVQTAGLVCLACQQGLSAPVTMPLTEQTYDSHDLILFDQASRWDDDDDVFADLS